MLRLVTVPLRGAAGDGPKVQGREVLTRVFPLVFWIVVDIRFLVSYGQNIIVVGHKGLSFSTARMLT